MMRKQETSTISTATAGPQPNSAAPDSLNLSVTRAAFAEKNLPLTEEENVIINSRPRSQWPSDLLQRHDSTSLRDEEIVVPEED